MCLEAAQHLTQVGVLDVIPAENGQLPLVFRNVKMLHVVADVGYHRKSSSIPSKER